MEFCKDTGKPLKETSNLSASEKLQEPIKKGEGIAEKNIDEKGFPHECKKCGHRYADVADLGVQYSDEASVYLFKCKKCGHTERDAYGCSNK